MKSVTRTARPAPAAPKARKLPLDLLRSRPNHLYRMSPRVRRSLTEQIAATGLYPPLIVRPLGGAYEILDGHRRAEILAGLGRRYARCEVWPVGEEQAEILAATLNHLRSQAEARRRARAICGLVRRLGRSRAGALLGMTPAGIRQQQVLSLAKSPPPLAIAGDMPLQPVTFHMAPEDARQLDQALRRLGALRKGRPGQNGKAGALLAALLAEKAASGESFEKDAGKEAEHERFHSRAEAAGRG